MEFNTIMELFSSTGVPVACLIATFWLWNKEREEHKQETAKLTEAINNNTIVIERVLEALHNNENG